jgi:hypothetical protein
LERRKIGQQGIIGRIDHLILLRILVSLDIALTSPAKASATCGGA